MRSIGLLGGMSWESTAEYYRLLNEQTRDRLGPYHQPVVLLHSVDFSELVPLQQAGDWDTAGALLAEAAIGLVAAGAGVVAICANTMHIVAPAVRATLPDDVRFVSVIEATKDACRANGFRTVGLLGTAYTMEHPFYAEGLREHGLEVVTPDAMERAEVHRVVYEELVRGEVVESSRLRHRAIVESLRDRGADAVLLACTEQAMLDLGELTDVALVDTTEVHVAALLAAATADP